MRRQMTMLALASVSALLGAEKINAEQAGMLNKMAYQPMRYNSPMFSPSRSRRIKNKRLRARK